jgi:4-amino-4-deoxy-L-arabinose transferase-like glycosyltransferase
MQSVSPELNTFTAFVRRNRWHFLVWATVALLLRVFFLLKFRLLTDDSMIYGEIAKNWLQHGVFGQTFEQGPEPTLIRMPGYPLFLVLTWIVAGVEHYTAALIVQVMVDVITCFAIADIARRISSDRAAKVAFVLAALCPFFANYSAVALTETWAIFFAALAINCAVATFDDPTKRTRWVICGVGLAGGILLRPDGGILLAVIGGCALVMALRIRSRQIVSAALLTTVIALAPLVPWAIRNWRVFRVFQPLTPINANMPWEFVPHGFQRWARTWIADYSSVEDVWFKVAGSEVTVNDLPPRAIDDEMQRQQTDELFNRYVANGNAISPEIDAGFNELARERIRRHPVRYYMGLPLLRATDLWLRPRTEMLPIDSHWWRLSEDDPPQFRWSVLLGAINLVYLAAAVVALVRGRVRYAALLIAFAVVRTAFLAWMPNPEPRYVLECYPAVIAMAGAAFGRKRAESREGIPGSTASRISSCC